jgi:dTDP-4-dehydrorhamnose 3,5-epimerase
MKIIPTSINGCFEILPRVIEDVRGRFVKTFHQDIFDEYGLATNFIEQYYSVSHKGVLRGLHFQTPPHDHAKLVYCLTGKVLDVIVDLRVGSPTFGKFELIELDSASAKMLYISTGMAHGFYALEDDTIMQYHVTSVYAPAKDTGIRWDSAGIPWPAMTPILSERDAKFALFADFASPFLYESGK